MSPPDVQFSSQTLSDQVTTFSTEYGNALNQLSDLSGTLHGLKSYQCITDSSQPCTSSELQNFNTDIQDALNNITNIRDDGTELTNNLLKNNTVINSALAQINSNYMLNSKVSGRTVDNLTQQNKELNQEVANKRRMTEINTYYSNMNTYINVVIRNLIIILAIIIFFTILSKKGILPQNISTMITVVCVLGIIAYVIYTIYDINIRDKFNFSEYVIPFDPTAKHLEASGNLTDIRKVLGNELMAGINDIKGLTSSCIGKSCCEPGTIYDINVDRCILDCSGDKIYKQVIDVSTGKPKGECVDKTTSA